MARYFIAEWLTGMVDFNVPQATIRAILFNNGISIVAEVKDLTEKEMDLCLADLYMWLVTSSSSTSGEFVSDGGWQHREASKVVANRSELRKKAEALYRKWGSDKANTIGGKSTMKDLY